jgi:hypothetical protein
MWKPVLGDPRKKAAVRIALDVAGRLRDHARVETAAMIARTQTSYPRSVHWHPAGVAQGYAGLAIMCGYLDSCFPEEGWDASGHRFLETAVGSGVDLSTLPAGLYSGLAGLAFAAWTLSRRGTRYSRLLAALEGALIPDAVSLARRLGQARGVSVHEFDVVSGAAGVGAYLLWRKDDPAADAALRLILESLVALTEEDNDVPRWHTSVPLLDEEMAQTYPQGNLNCGLAHGIPGPLTLLALSHLSGVTVDKSAEALRRLASWLLSHRADDDWGINWPPAVPLEEPVSPSLASTASNHAPSSPASSRDARGPSRAAWCYGSPGVARALWLTGQALKEQHYCDVALDAIQAVYRRPLPARQIDSPTFCHGVAGLLQITLRFAHDTNLPVFVEAAQGLCEQLLALYDAQTLLGYYSLEPSGRRVDQPGLLDGAAGVSLVLLAASTPREPVWDRLFLLA